LTISLVGIPETADWFDSITYPTNLKTLMLRQLKNCEMYKTRVSGIALSTSALETLHLLSDSLTILLAITSAPAVANCIGFAMLNMDLGMEWAIAFADVPPS
jgi:hypothetical protein